MMKLVSIVILLSLSLTGCTSKSTSTGKDSIADSSVLATLPDSLAEVAEDEDKTEVPSASRDSKQGVLVLSANELRYVDRTTGSSREIPTGTVEDRLVNMVNNLLNLKPASVGINSECGAGPLKVTTWSNGLTILFKENKLGEAWEFVGWSMGSGQTETPRMTTMSNIGIGSTREEMESTYSIKVEKTSLGYEFSTVPGGLYGIFSGPGKAATITSFWSGTSCVFR